MPVQKRTFATKSDLMDDDDDDDEELSEDASLVGGNDDNEKYIAPTAPRLPSTTLTHKAKAQLQAQAQSQTPLQRLRRFLKFYVSFVASASHQDQALKVLQWTLWLLSTSCSPSRSQVKALLRKYYLDIGYVRFGTRLLGLPVAIEAVLSGSWAVVTNGSSPRFSGLHRQLGTILATSMLGYYPLEHAAYALWMMPSNSTVSAKHQANRTAERLSAWSCRFWLLYILAETTQCALQWKELRDEQQKQQVRGDSDDSKAGDNDDDDETTTKERAAALQHAVTNTQLQLSRNALFFLPCVHWALPNWDRDPWLPERFVNTLMWMESCVCLYQSVRREPAIPALLDADVNGDVRPLKEE
jgi:hypothetical protein